MLYHEILLVPATGHFGPKTFVPGLNCGHFFEFELARDLIQTILEELDNDRIRARAIEAWNPPGIARPRIAAESDKNTLSIHVIFGRHTGAPTERNATVAYSSDPQAAPVARILCDAAADWGVCCNFDHISLGARAKNGFFPHHAVLLEPFSLVTKERDLYVARLHALGITLARTLSEFMQRGNHAQRYRPLTAWQNEKSKASEDKSLVSEFFAALDDGRLETFADYEPDAERTKNAKADEPEDKPKGDDNVQATTPQQQDALPKAGDSGHRADQKKASRQSGNGYSKAR